jgi:Ca2+-binding EF-hand superfamily protein
MKKLLVIAVLACAISSLTVTAAEGKKKELTEEQQKTKKELIAKYDTDKNGKIDKEERAKMTKEDKEKWSDLAGRKKKE